VLVKIQTGVFMSEEKQNVTIEVKVENAVLTAAVKADLVGVLRDLAKDSSNSIDDALVEMVALAAQNLDWKGYAKGIL
jgi:hypothetical protein